METKFNLIKSAQDVSEKNSNVQEHFNVFGKAIGVDGKSLMESATQVLAGLRAIVSDGKPLTTSGLSAASIAGVVAGVDLLVKRFPDLDATKQQRVAHVLHNVELGSRMTLGAVQAVANLAEKNPDRENIRNMFVQYEETGEPSPNLVQFLSQLQQSVDVVLRTPAK